MKRLNSTELEKILICPNCSGGLVKDGYTYSCIECKSSFPFFRDRPVLMSSDNELFPLSAYKDEYISNTRKSSKSKIIQSLKKLIPTKSINIPRDQIFHELSKKNCSNKKLILVVGCGNQGPQLERYFKLCDTAFVFCDVDKNADADIFCDSHELPIKSNSFNGVITTAVLEHVLYPDKVVSEIYRVLKDDGFIYTEIPFLQSVHEGAYDFTRFTMSGHRRLLEYFKEIESGMVAGPGTALVWSIDDFMKSLTANRAMSKMFSVLSRVMFFWIKYFDYLMKNNPNALNSSSCTFFLGTKGKKRNSSLTIIELYKGSDYLHT